MRESAVKEVSVTDSQSPTVRETTHPLTLQTLWLTFLRLQLVLSLHYYKRINHPRDAKITQITQTQACVRATTMNVMGHKSEFTIYFNKLNVYSPRHEFAAFSCTWRFDCVASSPGGSLLRYPQTVQVRLLPSAASLLRRVDVAREEGSRWVAVGRVPVAVLLWVPLIGQVVGVFKGAILMSGCRWTEKLSFSHRCRKRPAWILRLWGALPGGPGADRDGIFWCILDALERPWLKLFRVGPEEEIRRSETDRQHINWRRNSFWKRTLTLTLTSVLWKARSNADLQGFARRLQSRHISLTLNEQHLPRAASAQEAPVFLLQLHLQSEQQHDRARGERWF